VVQPDPGFVVSLFTKAVIKQSTKQHAKQSQLVLALLF
jgi:hypothetical protein